MIENFLPSFVRQNKLASLLGLAIGGIGCLLFARWYVSKNPPSERTTKKSDATGRSGIKPNTGLPNPMKKPQNLQLLEDAKRRILTLKANNTVFQVQQKFLDQYDLLSAEARPDFSEYVDGRKYLACNRYNGIIPFKKNMFQFKNPSNYFNASRVLQGRAISCQGPLPNEHDNFWRMA